VRVVALDQRDLPGAYPVLQGLFALNGLPGTVMDFEIDEGLYAVVFGEAYDRAEQAIQREKILKHWVRDWKIALIERDNPFWDDLYESLCR